MTVTARPVSPTIGLEISGRTGPDFTSPSTAAECRAGLAERCVVIYRDAHVDDAQLVAFSRLLGRVQIVPRGAIDGHPEIAPVTRDRTKDAMAAYRQGTFYWHIDGATDLVPNKTTLLTARDIADGDEGDTEFANTYAAYEAMPDAERDAIEDLRAVHSFAAAQSLVPTDPSPEQAHAWNQVPAREHPLVWRRADGRRSLLVGATAGELVDRPALDGQAVLEQLLEWCTQPRFVLRHRWRRGDLVVWDNTGLLHRALPYASESARLMHRTTIEGEEAIT